MIIFGGSTSLHELWIHHWLWIYSKSSSHEHLVLSMHLADHSSSRMNHPHTLHCAHSRQHWNIWLHHFVWTLLRCAYASDSFRLKHNWSTISLLHHHLKLLRALRHSLWNLSYNRVHKCRIFAPLLILILNWIKRHIEIILTNFRFIHLLSLVRRRALWCKIANLWFIGGFDFPFFDLIFTRFEFSQHSFPLGLFLLLNSIQKILLK